MHFQRLIRTSVIHVATFVPHNRQTIDRHEFAYDSRECIHGTMHFLSILYGFYLGIQRCYEGIITEVNDCSTAIALWYLSYLQDHPEFIEIHHGLMDRFIPYGFFTAAIHIGVSFLCEVVKREMDSRAMTDARINTFIQNMQAKAAVMPILALIRLPLLPQNRNKV